MENMEQKIQQFISILKSKGFRDENIYIDKKNKLIKIKFQGKEARVKFALLKKLSNPISLKDINKLK